MAWINPTTFDSLPYGSIKFKSPAAACSVDEWNEVMDWCNLNIGTVGLDWIGLEGDMFAPLTFWFAREEDAVMFGLRFA